MLSLSLSLFLSRQVDNRPYFPTTIIDLFDFGGFVLYLSIYFVLSLFPTFVPLWLSIFVNRFRSILIVE